MKVILLQDVKKLGKKRGNCRSFGRIRKKFFVTEKISGPGDGGKY